MAEQSRIESKLTALKAQLAQLQRNADALSGAIQVLEQLLADNEAEGDSSPSAPSESIKEDHV